MAVKRGPICIYCEEAIDESAWNKMRKMIRGLSENEWQFSWRVDITSPRGSVYSAESHEPSFALLKAFGLWKESIVEIVKQAHIQKIKQESKEVEKNRYMRVYMQKRREQEKLQAPVNA